MLIRVIIVNFQNSDKIDLACPKIKNIYKMYYIQVPITATTFLIVTATDKR